MPCAIHPNVLTELSTCSRCGKSFCGDCIITLRGAVVCAGCKGAMVQDVKSGSVEGELELAGRGARLWAAIIDGIVQGVACVVVMVCADPREVGGMGLRMLGVPPKWLVEHDGIYLAHRMLTAKQLGKSQDSDP